MMRNGFRNHPQYSGDPKVSASLRVSRPLGTRHAGNKKSWLGVSFSAGALTFVGVLRLDRYLASIGAGQSLPLVSKILCYGSFCCVWVV